MKRLPGVVRISVIALVLVFSYGLCLQADVSPSPLQSAFAGSANGQTTLSATFPNPPTANHLLIAIVSVKPGDSISGVSSPSGPWYTAINEAGTTSPRRPGQAIFFRQAGPDDSQVTATTSATTIGLQIFEYGRSGFNPDGLSRSNGPGNAPATVGPAGASSQDIYIAGITIDTPDSITAVTNDFIERFDFVAGSAGGRLTCASADRIGVDALAITTFSHGNNVWRAQMVAFQQF